MAGEQLSFLLPFGEHLDPKNRWMHLARLMPWDVAETVYGTQFNGLGRRPLSSRIAVGALFIKEQMKLSDRETVEQVRENPYLQAFLGYGSFSSVARFDHTTMALFRERLGAEGLQRINAVVIERALAQPEEAGEASFALASDVSESADHDDPDGSSGSSRATGATGASASPTPKRDDSEPDGELMIDATCAPADITFPTDLKLLNHGRELTEQIIDRLHAQRTDHTPKPRTYRRKARRAFLRSAKAKRQSASQRRVAARKQLRFIRRNLRTIATFIASEQNCLRAIGDCLYGKLLVISEVYRQQTLLTAPSVRRVDDRIVNIAQPHVRPILRGKASARTEFGAKISVSRIHGLASLDRLSWDAYHEGADLVQQADVYRQRTGHYPRVIYADKAYRTRANRAWCQQRSIRLAGQGPGRPPNDPVECHRRNQEARADEAARQPIEGIFGRAKRRFSLQRIMAKLARTSGAVIAMVFLVMNLNWLLVPLLILALISVGAYAFQAAMGAHRSHYRRPLAFVTGWNWVAA